MLVWICNPAKNMYHFHQLDELKALCYTSPDYTSTESPEYAHVESRKTSCYHPFSPSAPWFCEER